MLQGSLLKFLKFYLDPTQHAVTGRQISNQTSNWISDSLSCNFFMPFNPGFQTTFFCDPQSIRVNARRVSVIVFEVLFKSHSTCCVVVTYMEELYYQKYSIWYLQYLQLSYIIAFLYVIPNRHASENHFQVSPKHIYIHSRIISSMYVLLTVLKLIIRYHNHT